MALQLQRGLYRIDFSPLDTTTGAPGTPVLTTRPRSAGSTYEADTYDIEGGDAKLESGENNESMSIDVETAGIDLAFEAAVEGTTVVTTGSGATAESVMVKNVNANQRVPGRLRTQQRDKTGGHTIISFPKANLAGSPSRNAAQGEYMTPTMTFTAVPATDAVAADAGPPAVPAVTAGDLYQIIVGATYYALA